MSSRRVVITGMGAVSSIGTGIDAIARALREGRSGVVSTPWEGTGSRVAALPEAEPEIDWLDRRVRKTTTSQSIMAIRAADEALASAGLDRAEVRGSDLPVIIGAGTGSSLASYESCALYRRTGSTRRLSPFSVPKVMGSTAAANVSVAFGTRGESWAISSACSTGGHVLGTAAILIRAGRHDRILAGAADELDWTRFTSFDAMRALSRRYNDQPHRASRPFDAGRDGFVISAGAGVVLLEELETARRRGAPVIAEIAGYGATSDGNDMFAPDTAGAVSAMRAALADARLEPGAIDYVNAHGTSTPQGDVSEARAMAAVFGDAQPWISSTKSTTGHAIGAAGLLEAIYCAIMIRDGFLAPNVNLDSVDPDCTHLRLVGPQAVRHRPRTVLTNSFGFGGTNACLVLAAPEG